jgi:septal ring factor EnvC (AmiA/AmiB activator)
MTPDTTISVALIISIVSIACTLINTFTGGKKWQEEQNARDNNRQIDIEKNFVKINVKLDDFCDTTRQLLADGNEKTEQLKKVSEQLILVTEQVRTLFKYNDDHEKRISELEKREN